MSSPTSPSPSRAPRTPLNERSNSDTNKLGIRIVPYSPPRPDPEDEDGDGDGNGGDAESHGSGSSGGNDDHTGSSTPTRLPSRPREGYRTSMVPSSSPPSTPTRVKGNNVSGASLASESSGAQRTAPPTLAGKSSYGSNIRHVNALSQSSPKEEGPVSSTSRRPTYRRGTVINVHSDKTFSVVLKPTGGRNSDRSGSSTKTPSISNTSTITSQASFDATTDDRPSSPLSSVPERSVSSFTSGPSATPKKLSDDHSTASPWNYHMVGGLRKVPKTPDLKNKGKEREVTAPALPALPEKLLESSEPPSPLATKKSFATENSDSTIEETTNYKVIGRSSPPVPDSDSINVPSSSSSLNYKVLGHTSPPHPYNSSPEQGPIDTPGSRNFVVYDDPSPASSFATFARRPRPFSSDDSLSQEIRERYSQESLIIRPLRPRKGSASERTGFHRQQSGESLRGRSNSLSSISSIISQGTATLVPTPTPNLIRLHPTPAAPPRPHSSWAGLSNIAPLRPRMDAHQWSAQLSTVMSEYEGSEGGSRAGGSRGFGSMSDQGSSAPGSRGSRAILSISSSIGDNLDQVVSHSRSHSRGDSIERPSPAFMRGARELPSPPIRTVRDHDEHGDGLADLRQLHQLQTKSSRSRMGLLSRQASDISLRSSGSSRSRAGSFTSTPIPAWARLYYGSGERRWLATPSVISEGDSRPGSAWAPSGSPAHDFEEHIHNPRRRPKEVHPHNRAHEPIEAMHSELDIPRRPKKKTSSIWSPHLRLDRRASSYSMWDPPSGTWSADSRMLGKRNIQVLFFAVGFGIPFAWMIAAFLPLPPKPISPMQERNESTAELGLPKEQAPEPFRRQPLPVDDTNYQSARWWRNLNRFMSIVGLLILGAVAALVVIGVRQRWGR
ncbi:hypothetical protein F5X99DRAFT_432946 [Biscogniauxia marginata]|nr:hypothetical protein F5X99DRAFT_432946 [Biscogniauxia marginata]